MNNNLIYEGSSVDDGRRMSFYTLHNDSSDEDWTFSIESSDKCSQKFISRLAESIAAFAIEFGTDLDYTFYIPSYSEAIAQKFAEYILDAKDVPLSRRFATIKSFFNAYINGNNFFEDFEKSIPFIDDMLYKQVPLMKFDNNTTSFNEGNDLTWTAAGMYFNPFYASFKADDTYFNVVNISRIVMSLFRPSEQSDDLWGNYYFALKVLNVLYGNVDPGILLCEDSDNSRSFMPLLNAIDGKTKDVESFSHIAELNTFALFLKNGVFGDLDSLSVDELRELFLCFHGSPAARTLENFRIVSGEDWWENKHSIDRFLWFIKGTREGSSYRSILGISENSFVEMFQNHIMKNRHKIFWDGEILEMLEYIDEDEAVIDFVLEQTAFLRDVLDENIFDELWNSLCFSDFTVLFKRMLDTDFCDAILSVNRDDSYKGIPLHLAVTLA